MSAVPATSSPLRGILIELAQALDIETAIELARRHGGPSLSYPRRAETAEGTAQ